MSVCMYVCVCVCVCVSRLEVRVFVRFICNLVFGSDLVFSLGLINGECYSPTRRGRCRTQFFFFCLYHQNEGGFIEMFFNIQIKLKKANRLGSEYLNSAIYERRYSGQNI